MEKIIQGHGRETNTFAKCCTGLETHAQVLFFHIARVWQCFNWFKAFLVKIFFCFWQFKIGYAHDQQCCIFRRVLYGKNSSYLFDVHPCKYFNVHCGSFGDVVQLDWTWYGMLRVNRYCLELKHTEPG